MIRSDMANPGAARKLLLRCAWEGGLEQASSEVDCWWLVVGEWWLLLCTRVRDSSLGACWVHM